jgi:hypothetical protein
MWLYRIDNAVVIGAQVRFVILHFLAGRGSRGGAVLDRAVRGGRSRGPVLLAREAIIRFDNFILLSVYKRRVGAEQVGPLVSTEMCCDRQKSAPRY